MHQPGEPSVEEILDSIKKVIARDNRDDAIAERRRRTLGSDMVGADDGERAEPADAEEAAEVLELDESEMVQADDRPGDSGDSDMQDGDSADDPLVRADTRTAMQQNFAALAMLSKPGKQPQIVRSGETSLEGLTRELLRPMLAAWLDENLPGMVEELVKAEITRIAGKRS
ncbi:DUF2497 domain-containing protein [Qipengyuania marisflavi]|uniref:DUF2497 domain-containing protein n=1 Tax=Qipengyuania marisflavi TaxID=2486356 RepID=A0A5S3P5A4_9SPHN|nr:DUF2497 domain-containing protein [Qipengyuania marisflavi]TMM48220.1 DUF2497 domain-containing protein [Qipengyuania marisflavi]